MNRRTNRRAQFALLIVVAFIVAMAVLGAIYGPEMTWRAVVLALSFAFFIGSTQLVFERDRARRAEYDKVRERATVKVVAGENLAKNQAVYLDADGRARHVEYGRSLGMIPALGREVFESEPISMHDIRKIANFGPKGEEKRRRD